MAILDEDLEKNLASLVQYFNETKAVTSKASKIKDQFANWYSNLGWYAKTVSADDTWNQARNYRDTFNAANAVTPQQQAAVAHVQNAGITSEQMAGNQAQAKLSSGLYAAPDPEPPLIPTEYKVVVVIGGIAAVLLAVYGVATAAPVALAGYAASRKRDRMRRYF